MKASTKQHNKEMAITELSAILKATKEDTLFTVIRHVSASGMSREISVKLIDAGRLAHLDWLVSEATGYKLGKRGIVVKGCGMDMGFHLVDSINRVCGTNLRQEWI
jgi:hypothetical protein